LGHIAAVDWVITRTISVILFSTTRASFFHGFPTYWQQTNLFKWLPSPEG